MTITAKSGAKLEIPDGKVIENKVTLFTLQCSSIDNSLEND